MGTSQDERALLEGPENMNLEILANGAYNLGRIFQIKRHMYDAFRTLLLLPFLATVSNLVR